jgi:hypothetical protein
MFATMSSTPAVDDHRKPYKRLVKPGLGFFSFETAWRTLQGYETMHMIRKGQVQGVLFYYIVNIFTHIVSLCNCLPQAAPLHE